MAVELGCGRQWWSMPQWTTARLPGAGGFGGPMMPVRSDERVWLVAGARIRPDYVGIVRCAGI